MPRGTTAAVARVPTARKGPSPIALTPEYVESLRIYSELLFKGGAQPKGVSRAEHLAYRIAVGRDLGISDTQAIANIMIVGGRPSVWGDLGMAMIRASGLLEDIEETFEGDPDTDEYAAVCRVKRVGAKRDRIARFSVGDARAAKLLGKAGPWQEYRDRQMMWRARGFATRDEFQDVLCGLIFTEEAEDFPATATARQVETTTVDVQAIVGAIAPGKMIAMPAGVTVIDTPADATPVAAKAQTQQVREDDPVKFLSPGQPDESAATTPISVKVTAGKLSDEQLDRLAELRDQVIERRGIADDDAAIDAMWASTLADYDVTTARDLTGEQAHELIADIVKALATPVVEPGPKARRRPEPVSAL